MTEQIVQAPMTLVVEGKYRILSKIGEGSFGKIFQGVNSHTDETVAIKIEKSSESSLLKNEAKIYKLLEDNPGIPKLRSFGKEGVFNYMVMDLLDKSLEDCRVNCGGTLSLKTVLGLGVQMLRRIETIHDNGIIHRDIKPDNFLIKDGSNLVNVIDFGLARRYTDKNGNHIKEETGRKLTGTARYASLNVHRGHTPSRRDDLESIGYVLLYLLLGKLPWQNIKCNDKDKRYMMIGENKASLSLWQHFPNVSCEFILYLDYCQKLEHDEDPDYDYLRNIFINLYKHHGYPADNVYDWDE